MSKPSSSPVPFTCSTVCVTSKSVPYSETRAIFFSSFLIIYYLCCLPQRKSSISSFHFIISPTLHKYTHHGSISTLSLFFSPPILPKVIMEKLQTSQFAKLVLIALFVFLFTPFVSTWMKPPFLFLLLNLLILALGAESGIFTSSNSKVQEEKPTSTTTTTTTTIFVSHKEKKDERLASAGDHGRAINNGCEDDAKVVGKPKADKIVKVVRVRSVKKCPSTPSLFFIDDHEDQSKEEEVEEDDEKTAADELSAQELFFKAENFIGNFYKQLKMQREESWNRIQDFYHRAI